MHIPDAVLDPRVAVVTGMLGAGGFAWALHAVERRLKERTTPLMGMMAAFVFAAQMVNFPVGPGVSGHLLGGVLAAVMLGPWAGAVVIGAVLIVQCFLFGDGGVTALGANFLNMGLVGSVGGFAIYAPIRRALGGRRGTLAAAMIAAWFTVLLAAGCCAVELAALNGPTHFFHVLAWMAIVHAAIGLGEAVITGLVVRLVLQTRPDLILDDPKIEEELVATVAMPARGWVSSALAGLAVALAIAVFLSPLASEFPDGLEFVGERIGFMKDAPEAAPLSVPAPMPDYQLTVLGSDHVKVATAAAGLVGTCVVFGVSWWLGRVFGRAESPSESSKQGAFVDAV